MMTVNEVSRLTGVSVRTLQYYDRIELLKPIAYTDAGYRLYDKSSLERMQQILLFRELEFPLKGIKEIVDAPGFSRDKALEQQIELLTLKKEHLEKLIRFAREIKASINEETGGEEMSFDVFDTKEMDEYAKQAKAQWGETAAYQEFEEKSKDWTKEDQKEMADQFMGIFAEFGLMLGLDPADEKVQLQVKKLQDYISTHYYHCTDEILSGLGKMYSAGGEFTENIDKVGGAGTAVFTGKAIEIYCSGRV